MALPKVKVQTKTVPSLNGETKYQIKPFTIKEQKILLNAKESIKNEDDNDKAIESLLESLEQVFNLCILNVDVKDLPSYDFPFLLLELRKISVDDVSTLNYRCKSKLENGEECGNEFQVKIDLNKIEIKGELKTKRDERIVYVDEGIGVCMKYPTFSNFKKIYQDKTDEIQALRLYMEYVFDDDGNIYPIAETTDEELEEFVSDLGPNVKKMQEWISNIPRPYFKMNYKCKKCGNTKHIELKELTDFF